MDKARIYHPFGLLLLLTLANCVYALSWIRNSETLAHTGTGILSAGVSAGRYSEDPDVMREIWREERRILDNAGRRVDGQKPGRHQNKTEDGKNWISPGKHLKRTSNTRNELPSTPFSISSGRRKVKSRSPFVQIRHRSGQSSSSRPAPNPHSRLERNSNSRPAHDTHAGSANFRRRRVRLPRSWYEKRLLRKLLGKRMIQSGQQKKLRVKNGTKQSVASPFDPKDVHKYRWRKHLLRGSRKRSHHLANKGPHRHGDYGLPPISSASSASLLLSGVIPWSDHGSSPRTKFPNHHQINPAFIKSDLSFKKENSREQRNEVEIKPNDIDQGHAIKGNVGHPEERRVSDDATTTQRTTTIPAEEPGDYPIDDEYEDQPEFTDTWPETRVTQEEDAEEEEGDDHRQEFAHPERTPREDREQPRKRGHREDIPLPTTHRPHSSSPPPTTASPSPPSTQPPATNPRGHRRTQSRRPSGRRWRRVNHDAAHASRQSPGPTSIHPDCDPISCQPPDCTCASYSHPGDFPVHKVPMMVMLTFDDAVTSRNFPFYQRIMNQGLRNPNGCPIRMTYFVCDDGNNDYGLTRRLYNLGHEVASHSQTHRYPESWWAYDADRGDYQDEFVGQRSLLGRRAGIPPWEIKGLRAPYLNLNGDNMMDIAKEFDFTYDSSCVGSNSIGYGNQPLWPYTLDHPPNRQMCEQETRPTQSFPGVWEVPLTKYSCDDRDEDSQGNYMLDECAGRMGNNTSGDIANFLWRHFSHHYPSRAPMGIFTHSSFIRDQPEAMAGLLDFLHGLSEMQDVWVVTVSQMLAWMRSPTPTDNLSGLDSWNCV